MLTKLRAGKCLRFQPACRQLYPERLPATAVSRIGLRRRLAHATPKYASDERKQTYAQNVLSSPKLFRLQNTRTPNVIDRLQTALEFREPLERGVIIVVKECRCRIRMLSVTNS